MIVAFFAGTDSSRIPWPATGAETSQNTAIQHEMLAIRRNWNGPYTMPESSGLTPRIPPTTDIRFASAIHAET